LNSSVVNSTRKRILLSIADGNAAFRIVVHPVIDSSATAEVRQSTGETRSRISYNIALNVRSPLTERITRPAPLQTAR